MSIVDKILTANKAFMKSSHTPISKFPQYHAAIVTCMDTRLVNFLEQAAGIERGTVKIIKTAGNTVGSDFNDVIKSLMICVYELQVKEIVVIGHYQCGMEKTTSQGLVDHMRIHGINDNIINDILPDLRNWADAFHTSCQNVTESVANIKASKYLPDDIPVHGLIIDPDTGKIDLIK